MDINEILHDRDIHLIEEEIARKDTLSPPDWDTCRSLLTLRKEMINDRVWKHKDEILPDVIAFNDALTKALRSMYDKAHEVWNNIKDSKCFDGHLILKAKCYLAKDIPVPGEGSHEDKLCCALFNISSNWRYDGGVTLKPLVFPRDENKSFDELIDMDCPQFHTQGDNIQWNHTKWRDDLDKELTEELHLSSAFYNLLYNMCFAITDFIYIRKFATGITIELWNED